MKMFASAPVAIAIALLALLLPTIALVSAADDAHQSPAEGSCSGSDDDDESCLAENNNESSASAATSTTTAKNKARRRRRRSNNDNVKNNAPVTAVFRNDSPHRADIHYDDGRFGSVVGAADPHGGTTKITTFIGHRFFVTIHGVREGLVDADTDEQYFFTVEYSNEDEEGEDDDEDEDDDVLLQEVLFLLPATAAPSKTPCKDRYPVCASEAARGECARNPGWMIVNCCQACDDAEGYGRLIDRRVRCDPARLNSTVPAWKGGSLDELFAKWATEEEYERYDPRVISSPEKKGAYGSAYGEGPWIMTFDNFLDEFEIQQLLEGAEYEGFVRSTDQGGVVGNSGEMAKVTSKSRTSSNAWCRGRCEGLEGVKRVTKRIEDMTGIPQNNYESLQILEYQVGQFYKRHHDSSGKKDKASGHRILTFFLYLNDVEEGGDTRFTDLEISIAPKKGRALVWPSVLNEDPEKSDYRMYHEAMAVTKGTKYAANHWIHQYDFVNSNLWGCGSFN